MREADPGGIVMPFAAIVRSAMDETRAHRSEQGGIDRLTRPQAGDATHDGSLRPLRALDASVELALCPAPRRL